MEEEEEEELAAAVVAVVLLVVVSHLEGQGLSRQTCRFTCVCMCMLHVVLTRWGVRWTVSIFPFFFLKICIAQHYHQKQCYVLFLFLLM